MTGTILNVIAIIFGSLLGVFIGSRLPKRVQESVLTGLGLVVLTIGLQNALRTGNIIIPLLSLVFGVIIGELLNVENAFERLGSWLQKRTVRGGEPTDPSGQARLRFISAFVTASLLYCIGPLAILGPIQNGMNSADIQLLVVKSALDFFASIAFASSLGIGVAFASIPTFILQAIFAGLGVVLGAALARSSGGVLDANNPYVRELTATGGLVMLGISLILLEIKRPRVSNFLPALLIAPLLIFLAGLLGLHVYPLG